MEKQMYDRNDIPIYPGDLIRSFHFTGAHKKRHYLYHTIVLEKGRLYMVPTSHLEPTKIKDGGKCLLEYGFQEADSEIISGYGPEFGWSFEDRPKRSLENGQN